MSTPSQPDAGAQQPDPDDLATPGWYLAAMAQTPDSGQVEVAGARVRWRAWGEAERAGLVLVHGGAAHSRWWDHIGPLLAQTYRVVAVDLSGHGDSGWRESYSLDQWAEELLAVADSARIVGPPVLIGHSMGGFVTLTAASLFGSALAGVVAIDSPVRELTPEEQAARDKRAFGPLRVYPTREAALARFRPIPDEGPTLDFVVRHIAEQSIKQVEGGWSWKFDHRVFGRPALSPSRLARVDCRVAVFRAERGLVSEEMGEVMYDKLGRAAPVIAIPDAGHHVMLDQPLSLVTGLRTLLADWRHSLPHQAELGSGDDAL